MTKLNFDNNPSRGGNNYDFKNASLNSAYSVGSLIKIFYIRHAIKCYGYDKAIEHCDAVIDNANKDKYGDVNLFGDPRNCKCKEQLAPLLYKVKAQEKNGISNLDKLSLTAMRFVNDFFDDAKKTLKKDGNPRKNALPYENVATNLIKDYCINIEIKKWNYNFLNELQNNEELIRILEFELVKRLNNFLKKDKEYNLTSITTLGNLTSQKHCKKFFLNLLLADEKNIDKYLKSPYRKSISSMYSHKCEIPNMVKVNEFFKNIEEYLKNNFPGINKEDIIPSIANMQSGQEIFEFNVEDKQNGLGGFFSTIENFCKTNNIKDFTKVFGSITGMQSGKGIPENLENLKKFLNKIIYCCEKINITDENEITNVLSSITGMLSGKGIPDSKNLDNLDTFLKIITSYCKIDLKIENRNEITKFLSSITSMQNGRGIPNFKNLEKFLYNLKKLYNEKPNISNKYKIEDIISEISPKFSRKGLPSYEELEKIFNDIDDIESYIRKIME